ncbi:MAG: DUF423 domain-containing protein [Gammaproteobacteria bacterium]
MNTLSRFLCISGAIFLMLALQLGAYGSHGLEGTLSAAKLKSWELAVQYQFYHSLGLILLGLLYQTLQRPALLKWAAWIMLAGMLVFSGSIYATILGAPEIIGETTPSGGSALMLAWLLTAIAVWKS